MILDTVKYHHNLQFQLFHQNNNTYDFKNREKGEEEGGGGGEQKGLPVFSF